MTKALKIEGLNRSDRVFKHGNAHVKVRLLKKEIMSANKLFGPEAVCFTLTAALCDDSGKAIADAKGNYAIFPHTLTIPLTGAGISKTAIKKGLDDAIKPLILKTVQWAKSREAADQVLNAWENDPA